MELVLNLRLVWDSKSLKEIDQAKQEYLKYKKKGYIITQENGATVERFNPNLEAIIVLAKKTSKHILKILTPKGDERVVWDKDNGPEAKQAKAKFNELLDKGYTAYSVDREGKKNRKIIEFDIDAEEILMVPKTIKG